MSQIIDIKKKVEQRLKDSEEKLKSGGSGDGIDSKFIMQCLNRNEVGDGELFGRLYGDHFIYNKAMDCWMYWQGHHWKIDRMGYASSSVDGVANVYQDEAKRLAEKITELEGKGDDVGHLKARRKLLNQRVTALRSHRRRKNCLYFAHTNNKYPLAIDGAEVDQKPWLLPCANGVVNLKTGELEPGRQKDYLLKASPVEWPKEGIHALSPNWESFLLEVLQEDPEMVAFLQRLLGVSLIGKVLEHFIAILSGERGRNGKGVISETVLNVLGPLGGAIRPEMLLDQGRIQNPSGPTPDIMALKGMRVGFASETDQSSSASPSKLKQLSGNDTLSGRNPNDKYEVNFKPSHSLFLLTNHDPHAPPDDFAFWERIIKVPFHLSYVNREPDPDKEFERRADPLLPEKLRDEYSQILAWMVRGCLEYQKIGLARPYIVTRAVKLYQEEEDTLGDFISERLIEGEDYHVTAAAVYEEFKEWWKENVSKRRVPSKKIFGKWFGKRFERVKKGTIFYEGVGLLSQVEGGML